MGRLAQESASAFDAEIQRRKQESEREELAYRKGFSSVAEMEESERRAQRNAQVRQNQQKYFADRQREETLTANRSRILAGEPVPELVAHLEKNPDLSTLDAGQKALVEVHAAQAASQQANEFVQNEPRYVRGEESQKALIGFMIANDLAPTAENFAASFRVLADHGLIAVRQPEAAPIQTTAPVVEATPVTVTPEVRNENPINPATGQPFTDRELEALSADEYARVFKLARGHQYRATRSPLGWSAIEDLNGSVGLPN